MLQVLCIAALLVSTALRADESSCSLWRLAERELAGELMEVSPREPLGRVSRRDVKNATEDTQALLKQLGGHYQRLTRSERVPLETALQSELRDEGTPQRRLRKEGHLYRILALPEPKGTDPLGPFLTHEGTGAVLNRLRDLGVEVYIDSSLMVTSAGGLYFPGKRRLLLSADLSYADLEHELSHAEFDAGGLETLCDTARARLRQGKGVDDLLDSPSVAHYGRERARQALELVAKGYPTDAIDEKMATLAGEEVMAKAGVRQSDAARARTRAYADRHLIQALAEEALDRPLRPEERNTLLEALARHALYDPEFAEGRAAQRLESYRLALDGEVPRRGGGARLRNGIAAGIALTITLNSGGFTVRADDGRSFHVATPPARVSTAHDFSALGYHPSQPWPERLRAVRHAAGRPSPAVRDALRDIAAHDADGIVRELARVSAEHN